LFSNSFQALNPKLLLKLASKFSFTSGFQVVSIPSKRASATSNNFKTFGINTNYSSYSRNSIVTILNPENNSLTYSKIGLSTGLDSPSRFYLKGSSLSRTSIVYPKLLVSKPTLNYVSSIRKILTLLTLLTLKIK